MIQRGPLYLVVVLCLVSAVLGGLLSFYLFDKDTEDTIVERHYTETVDTVYVTGPTRVVRLPEPSQALQATHTERDTVIIREVPYVVPEGQTVRRYSQAIQDTSLTGTLSATVQGELLDWDLQYQIHYPEITRTQKDSIVVIRREVPKNFGMFAGASASAILIEDQAFLSAGPYGGVRFGKTSIIYSPRYNINSGSLNHMVSIGISL
jgi:hypothetical protein